jgi:HSP20 family protein
MAERERERQGSRMPATRQEGRAPSPMSSRENPFGFMRRFTEQMDRLFEDFGFGGGLSPRIELGRTRFGETAWAPDIDVVEREGKVIIRADLPGLKRDEVQLEIRDNALWLSGERRQEQEQREEGYYRMERSYGSFCRAVPLPEGVDVDKAQASFRDGVLEVTVPVPPGREARRIEITEGSSQTAGRRAAS